METIFRLSICLAALTASSRAADHERVFSSKVELLSPARLVGELDHREALFGKFPVGENIVSNFYYTTRSLCEGDIPETPESVKQAGYFLLVDRGGCSFVEKVRNAQLENATAVFIADNTCLCAFLDYCEADQQCEDSEPTMDDDGTGDDIMIPSMLLLKPDGDRLKSEMMAGTMIALQLSWPVPKAVNGNTEYSLWMTPNDLVSHQFLMSFLDAAIALGDKASFRPRMFVNDGTEKGCRRYGDDDPCAGFCTNFGRYCEPRSYYDFDSYDNKGTKMVVETLRRACIWHIYGDQDGIGREWWTYVQKWILSCSTSHYSAECAESSYVDAGIDNELVEQCMLDSGNFRRDTANILLDSFVDEAADFDVTFTPTLFVNGAVIRGSLTFGNVLEAICMTYEEQDIPEICYQWKVCADDCTQGATCILQGDKCVEYEVPTFNHDEIDYDDDYLENDPSGEPAEEIDAVSIATIATTDEPTQSPVPSPTKSPVTKQTDSPVEPPSDPPVEAVTRSPSSKPSDPLVLPPTDLPVAQPKYPTDPPTEDPRMPVQPGGLYEDQKVIETIQIYENGGGSNAGFAIGLGAGIGGAVLLFGCALLLLMRDRQGQESMRPLVLAPEDMPMEDGSYYPEQYMDEAGSYASRGSHHSRETYREAPRRFLRKFRPRRSFRRSRKTADDEDDYMDEIPFKTRRRDEDALHSRSYGEEEDVVYLPRKPVGRKSSVRFQEDYDDDVSLS